MKKNELTQPQRQRTSVALQGLDLSSPDDIVKDGCCSILSNLRWKDNAWRPVHPHKEKGSYSPPASLGTKKIVYKHPASADNKYIIEHYYIPTVGSKQIYRYAEVDITTNDEVDVATFNEQQRVSHFGNVLYLGSDAYLLKDNEYLPYNMDETYPIIESSMSYVEKEYSYKPWLFMVDRDVKLPNIVLGGANLYANQWYEVMAVSGENIYEFIVGRLAFPSSVKVRFAYKFGSFDDDGQFEEQFLPNYVGGGWTGEHLSFAVLRMKDGTIINPSPLSLSIVKNDFTEYEFNHKTVTYGRTADVNTTPGSIVDTEAFFVICPWFAVNTNSPSPDYSTAAILYGKETISVSIPNTIDSRNTYSIALYSTRIYPSFNFNQITSSVDGTTFSARELFSDTVLIREPFYCIAEKPIRECEEVDGRFVLTHDINNLSAEKITTKTLYEPIITDKLEFNGAIDYNNRHHIFDISQRFKNFASINSLLNDEDSFWDIQLGLQLESAELDYKYWGNKINSTGLRKANSLILSAHDYRVSNFYAYTVGEGLTKTYNMMAKDAPSNNMSCYYDSSREAIKYNPISFIDSDLPTTDTVPSENTVLTEPNRLQVSSVNNPFSLPFDLSYKIGSPNNRIIALQSAALEMSDTKFGEFPLYIFTTEGIFAMQSGEETLYSNVIPINYDKIINPNTLAINGAIVYITEKGVHLLTNEGSAIISGPIHRRDGMPPLDFLRTCKIIHPKQYNEIVLHNERGIKAYVYNIDSKYWSTRKLMGYKINTDVLIDANTILDLGDEDEGKALSARIMTRPIKLGNVEFKRLETIIPRMSTGDKNNVLSLSLSGSLDGTTYATLRKYDAELEAEKVNPIVLRRTPFSAKYFSLFMNLTPVGETFSPSITHIDFEWYERFGRRMR